jgi:peptidoglycan-associated lipoprotein
MFLKRILTLGVVITVSIILLIGCGGGKELVQEEPLLEDPGTGNGGTPVVSDSLAMIEEQVALEEARADSIAQVVENERLRLETERLEAARFERERVIAEEKAAKESFKTINFDFDQSQLSAEARDALQFNAGIMRKYESWKVIVEGHCDNRGTTEYNLALGERRAASVKQYYIDYGIDENRLQIISYGEERPTMDGSGDVNWSKNRRAETVVR